MFFLASPPPPLSAPILPIPHTTVGTGVLTLPEAESTELALSIVFVIESAGDMVSTSIAAMSRVTVTNIIKRRTLTAFPELMQHTHHIPETLVGTSKGQDTPKDSPARLVNYALGGGLSR